ncbi:MAG: RHS repeat-associated core domain-containing protein, partial [Bacteroidota bacterium]
KQLTTAALRTAPHDYEQISLNDIIADREGYILAYLSNENAEKVAIHWDDFTVYHGKTNVVFASDYYPFGGQFGEYQRTASTPQRFKFQGKERVAELGLDDFGARFYMPDLGRWMSPDPLAHEYMSFSLYNFVLNNPINAIDPDGKRVFFVAGAGNDPDGWNYVNRFGNAFTQAGIGGFIPIAATGGKVNDILFTSRYRHSGFETYSTGSIGSNFVGGLAPGEMELGVRPVQHKQIDNAVSQIRQNLADNPLAEGEQFNLAGYSYGSVLQAQAALQLANDGQYIDNLILIGSPIADDSDLFDQLSNNENIGNVLRVDIEGDLLSNPQDIIDYLRGAGQNFSDDGPHFDLARPGVETDRLQQIVSSG